MPTLQDFTEEDLDLLRRVATKRVHKVKCALCRKIFVQTKTNQKFGTTSCRIKYWKMKQIYGEEKLKEGLDELERRGLIGSEGKHE